MKSNTKSFLSEIRAIRDLKLCAVRAINDHGYSDRAFQVVTEASMANPFVSLCGTEIDEIVNDARDFLM